MCVFDNVVHLLDKTGADRLCDEFAYVFSCRQLNVQHRVFHKENRNYWTYLNRLQKYVEN